MKDLVGPGEFTLTNCGTITIIKETNPAGIDQGFGFTSDIAGSELQCSPDTTPAAFTLNDGSDATDSETCTNVPAGSYTVTEGANPTGFEFESLDCVSSGTGTSASEAGKVASITLAGGGSVTCTYVNKLQQGAIQITKTRKHAADGAGNHAHAGVDFTVDGVTKTTDANGVACFDGLDFGNYTVTETVPAGYSVDANDKVVAVDQNGDCDAGYETVSFHNTPLTDIKWEVDSQVAGGTSTVVDCKNGSGTSLPGYPKTVGDGNDTFANLLPTAPGVTVTCEFKVDP